MKKKFLSIALLVAVLSLASCGKKVTTETTEVKTVDTTTTPATEYKDGESIEVTGVVKEINRGKDGYTAKIETADGKKYGATISIPNLTDPKQFRSVKEGDKITVKGEVTNFEAEAIIVVRELK